MDFQQFQDSVYRHYTIGKDFRDRTGEDGGARFAVFSAIVSVRGRPVTIRLSHPYTNQWNAFPVPPQGREKAVIGAESGDDALRQLAGKL